MKPSIHNQGLQLLATIITLCCTHAISFSQATQVKLTEGTEVRLKLMEAMNSGAAQNGQTVSFQVLDEVRVDGAVVITEGAAAWGTVVEAEEKKRMGRSGKLAIRVDYVKAVDGTKIPLRATSVNQAKGRGTAVGIATGATALVFWPAAPFFLLMKGKNVELPRGQHLPAFVDGDRIVKVLAAEPTLTSPPEAGRRYDASGTSGLTQVSLPLTPVARNAGTTTADIGTINVISDPGGAEIEIDGTYYGNTPSLIKLPGGLHTISIRSAGYDAWKRTLNIGPGSNLTVKADC